MSNELDKTRASHKLLVICEKLNSTGVKYRCVLRIKTHLVEVLI